MVSIDENAADDIVGHRLALLRFEAGTAEALLKAYGRALRDLDVELRRLQGRVARGESVDRAQLVRLVSLGNDLDRRIRELRTIAGTTLDERIEAAAQAEAAFQRSTMRATIGTGWRVPETAVVEALKGPGGSRPWARVLDTALLDAREVIGAELATMLARGASIDRIARALRDGAGIIETYRGRLVAIARTETQRVANDVAIATYEENSDVVEGMEWLATLDSRTCLLCAPLHGRRWRMVDGRAPASMPRPPLHPRCRCFLAPVTAAWSERDAAEQEAARARAMTFEQWLRRRPEAEQLDVLGATRHRLWRSGEVRLSQFSDAGRLLTVEELTSRYTV